MAERWIPLTLTVMVLFALGSFFGKAALIKDSSTRVYFFEAIGTLTVFSIFFFFKRAEITDNFWVNQYGLLMGLSWGIGTVLFIYVLQFGKLSIILPLTALYPAITVLLAILFLNESINLREIIGIMFAVMSGVLLAR